MIRRVLAAGAALVGLGFLVVGLGQALNGVPWAFTVGGALLMLVAATGLALLPVLQPAQRRNMVAHIPRLQSAPPGILPIPNPQPPTPTFYVRLPGTTLPLHADDPDDLLLDYLLVLTPQDFEHFCRVLLETLGYEQVQVQGKAGDEGVDLTMRRAGALIIAQCKRYQGKVGAPAIRDFYGALMHTGAAQGFFITTGDFTQAAQDWAAGKPIQLVNHQALIAAVRRYLLVEGAPGQGQ